MDECIILFFWVKDVVLGRVLLVYRMEDGDVVIMSV